MKVIAHFNSSQEPLNDIPPAATRARPSHLLNDEPGGVSLLHGEAGRGRGGADVLQVGAQDAAQRAALSGLRGQGGKDDEKGREGRKGL